MSMHNNAYLSQMYVHLFHTPIHARASHSTHYRGRWWHGVKWEKMIIVHSSQWNQFRIEFIICSTQLIVFVRTMRPYLRDARTTMKFKLNHAFMKPLQSHHICGVTLHCGIPLCESRTTHTIIISNSWSIFSTRKTKPKIDSIGTEIIALCWLIWVASELTACVSSILFNKMKENRANQSKYD